jgi:hypothetical protein
VIETDGGILFSEGENQGEVDLLVQVVERGSSIFALRQVVSSARTA